MDISPAPGRRVVPLPRGWTLVFLSPLPGRPVVAVGLFLDGDLRELIDRPDDVRGYERIMASVHLGQSG